MHSAAGFSNGGRVERSRADLAGRFRRLVGPSSLNILRDGFSRQHVLGLFAHHDGAQLGLEADDHADLLLVSPDVVPGKEEVIGVAEFRVGFVVLFELFGPENVLSSWPGIGRLSPVFVEGVDDQVAIDLDRLLFFAVIEHQLAAESACGRFALRVLDRVDPNGNHAVGRLNFVVFVVEERDREGLFHVQLAASAEQAGQRDEQNAPGAIGHCLKPGSHWNDFLANSIRSIARRGGIGGGRRIERAGGRIDPA